MNQFWSCLIGLMPVSSPWQFLLYRLVVSLSWASYTMSLHVRISRQVVLVSIVRCNDMGLDTKLTVCPLGKNWSRELIQFNKVLVPVLVAIFSSRKRNFALWLFQLSQIELCIQCEVQKLTWPKLKLILSFHWSSEDDKEGRLALTTVNCHETYRFRYLLSIGER